MASARKELRQDIVARLKAHTGVTALVSAANIFDSRSTRLGDEAVPAINVHARKSRRSNTSIGAPRYEVKHTVEVHVAVTGTVDATIAASLDDVLEAVVAALAEDADFVSAYESIEQIDEDTTIATEGNRKYGLGKVSFEIEHSEVRSPDLSGESDLVTVQVDVDAIEPETGAPDGTTDVALTLSDLDE